MVLVEYSSATENLPSREAVVAIVVVMKFLHRRISLSLSLSTLLFSPVVLELREEDDVQRRVERCICHEEDDAERGHG